MLDDGSRYSGVGGALHIAASTGDAGIVAQLIGAGANLNLPDDIGETVRHEAQPSHKVRLKSLPCVESVHRAMRPSSSHSNHPWIAAS